MRIHADYTTVLLYYSTTILLYLLPRANAADGRGPHSGQAVAAVSAVGEAVGGKTIGVEAVAAGVKTGGLIAERAEEEGEVDAAGAWAYEWR